MARDQDRDLPTTLRGKIDHMIKPTPKQAEVLEFMREYQLENGSAPSIREIAERLGVSSTNGIADHLKALENKGLVRRSKAATRGWVPR